MSKSRSAIELFSPEYWKEWKERSNVGPLIDPEEEKRMRACKKKNVPGMTKCLIKEYSIYVQRYEDEGDIDLF